MVTRTSLPPASRERPRASRISTGFRRTERAAVAPMATTTAGSTSSSSLASHHRHCSTCPMDGFWCMRLLPRRRKRKCLTALVTNTSWREMPAASSARSSMRPAGPTNGRPLKSSSEPGCSPTSISGACAGPSPGTPCVAGFHSSQRRHASTLRGCWSGITAIGSAEDTVPCDLQIACHRVPFTRCRRSERKDGDEARAALYEVAAAELEMGVVVQVAYGERRSQALGGLPAEAQVDRGEIGDAQ